ncbi:MAG: RNase adapter RapZ [Azospirillaceae bacterium]|nr:RNase adapter RapZ [Azospirillaceae bacterium]
MTTAGDDADGVAGPADDEGKRPIVLVTGMSGAGLSTTLKSLEDLGYEAVDNLPLGLVATLVAQGEPVCKPLAIGIDARTQDFTAQALLARLEELRLRPGLSVRLLFLECGDEVLQRRYTETRRRHPLAIDRPVSVGIACERAIMVDVRDNADIVVDTTQLSIHDLRRVMGGYFQLTRGPGLHLFVTSFSFRQGVPRDADLVFDVRFLINPHWDPALRPLSGLDAAVAERVASDPDFDSFFDHLTTLLRPLLPRYSHEGKSYLTIAVGCTGGRHRSVFVAEKLAAWLRDQDYQVGLTHRDLGQGGG